MILAPSLTFAEQFVLFDVTFTFTKADADTSTPSKSHYYVKGAAINPNRPVDWTSPVDYRNGTLHVRLEVVVTGRLAANGEAHELLSFLLGWGGKVEVLEPAAIRRRLADELRRAARRYDPG